MSPRGPGDPIGHSGFTVPHSSITRWMCTKSQKDGQNLKNTGVRQAFFLKRPSRRADPSLDGWLSNTACHTRGVRSNRRRGGNFGGQLTSVEVGFSHWPRSPCFYISIPCSIFDAWYWHCLGNSWHSGCCWAWPAFWLQVQLQCDIIWFL